MDHDTIEQRQSTLSPINDTDALPPSQPAVAAPPALEKRQDTSDTSPQDCTLTTLAGFNEGYTEVHSLTETQVFLPPWRCACAGDAEVEVYETQSYGTCGTVLWWPKIADGFAAFFKSSLCADGGTTLFCGTSTEGSVAQTTIIPEPSPGSANSPGWYDVECTGSLDNKFNDASLQWNDSGGAAAYDDMLYAWNSAEGSAKDSFPNFVANSFHFQPRFFCEIAKTDECDAVTCGQSIDGSAPASAPAGYVLADSFDGVHHYFDDPYESIESGLVFTGLRMDKFVDTFSPINVAIEDQRQQKLVYDALEAALVVTLAPGFHTAFRRLPWAENNPNDFSIVIDLSYNLIGVAFAAVKDAMRTESTQPVSTELKDFVVDVAEQWLGVIAKTKSDVLMDPERTFEFIDRGKFFPGDKPADPFNATKLMEKTLFAISFRSVWSMVADGQPMPVIVTSEGIPKEGDNCDAYQPENQEPSDGKEFDVFDDAFRTGLVCDDGAPYWLVAVAPAADGCPAGSESVEGCVPWIAEFSTPYGFEHLAEYNFTKEKLACNAENSWEANGKKNEWSGLELAGDREALDGLVGGDIAAGRGLVTIPVCSLAEVFAVLRAESSGDLAREENPNYPSAPSVSIPGVIIPTDPES